MTAATLRDTVSHMYASVRLTGQALEDLRAATISLTSPAGRKLAMSEVLVTALAVARRHPDETLAALRDQNGQ